MQIIYPRKTSSDIRSEIQKYTDAHEKTRKFPTWWVFVSIIWSLFNVCLILIALRLYYRIMSNAPYIHFEFMGYNGNFMTALFIVALGLLTAIFVSGGIKRLIRGLIFPESRKADDYSSVQKSLEELLGEYESAEQLKRNDLSCISFQLLNERNLATRSDESNLCISTVFDGFKKDFCFVNGTYKVTTSEDNTNTIDLSLLDSLVDDMTSKTVITN